MKTILVDAFNTFVIAGHGINEQMHEMLELYPNRKIIVSNANDEEVISLGMTNLPYEFFSLKHEPNKTDPKYFEILFEKLNLSKENVVYFEHNEDAVKSAQSLGIKTFHYDKDKKDLLALKNFLNENL